MLKRLFPIAFAAAFMTACYYIPAGGPAGADVKLSRALGSNITGSIVLTVSGPGMETVTQTYAASSSGTATPITVPSGVARTFTITAQTPSATLSGSATVDLSPGETRSIALDPKLSDTRIIVPDYLRNRLVQIDDMTGAGWKAYLGATGAIRVQAVDFDNDGWLYVADYSTNPLRISDIEPTTIEPIDNNLSTCTSIAVDRTHNYVYYATNISMIYRKALSNLVSPADTLDIMLEGVLDYQVTRMAVDDNGVLYLLLLGGNLRRYDPSRPVGSRITATVGGLSNPQDVMVKNGFVYVCNTENAEILRFTLDLAPVDSFTGPAANPLWGPTRFLARQSRGITLLDEHFLSMPNDDRLVHFDDMTGAGFTTYGSEAQFAGFFQYAPP